MLIKLQKAVPPELPFCFCSQGYDYILKLAKVKFPKTNPASTKNMVQQDTESLVHRIPRTWDFIKLRFYLSL